MKKITIIIAIIVVMLCVIKAPDAIHRFKTYGLRAKQSLAKMILKCSRSNLQCINFEAGTVEKAIENCPKVQCFNENINKYYKTIYKKKIPDQKEILILKGYLSVGSDDKIDVWAQTADGINVHCIDGSGWDPNSTNPICHNI